MELQDILNEITSNLTGDNEKDLAYLQQQSDKYKDHKYGKEILRACGRLMFNLIDEDEKKEFKLSFDNDAKATEALIKEIRFSLFEGDIDKAFKLSESLVLKVEEMPMFEDDAVSEYYNFDNTFELILYVHHNKPEKDIRHASKPYSEIFHLHGYLLFELKRIPEARKYLEKALKWNPVSCTSAFEYIETYKAENQFEKFYELTMKQFKYAYKPQDVARCFRNLGYYYIEKGLHSLAAVCYVLSLNYDKENKAAQAELYYIDQTAPKGYQKPTVELLKKYEKEYNLPTGADKDVIGLAYSSSLKAIEDGVLEWGVYFLEIAYNLTFDENIYNTLVEMKEKLAKMN